jgi:hypothetical protein
MVQAKLSGLNEKEAHDALMSLVSSETEPKNFEMVSCGLLYGLLTDAAQSAKVTTIL